MRFTPIYFILVAVLLSCGKIPEDSPTGPTDQSSDLGERIFESQEWGFRMNIPDNEFWGWTSSTNFNDRLDNGLPRLVLFIRSASQNRSFRPTLTVVPGVAGPGGLTGAVVAAEENLKSQYLGYRAEPKETVSIGGLEAVQWTFETVTFRSIGNQFFVTILVDGNKRYFMIGSGLWTDYPLEEYREIVSSFQKLP